MAAEGHQYAYIRRLFRTTRGIRVVNAFSGVLEDLSPTYDTPVDLNNKYNRRQLERHSAIGQWYVTGLNNTGTIAASGEILTTLPANHAGEGNEPSNQIP